MTTRYTAVLATALMAATYGRFLERWHRARAVAAEQKRIAG